MTKSILAVLVLLSCVPPLWADTVGIEMDAGILRTTGGANYMPISGLLQIIYNPTSTSATFSQITAGSFTSGSDQLLVSLAMNYGNGTGETDNSFAFTDNSNPALNSPSSFDVGEPFALRWFPQFELSGGNIIRNPDPLIGGVGPNTPQVGDFYGQFFSSTGEGGGISWLAPSGGNYTLIFNTTSAGGSHPDSDGFANIPVLVPEPSTLAFLFTGLLSGAFWLIRRRSFLGALSVR